MALAAAITVFVALSLSHFASSLTLFDAGVILDNNSNETLIASCRSNGAFIGTFTIPSLGTADFRTNVLVKQRSVATCSMKLGKLRGSFDVFDWGRDKRRCANRVCRWNIDQSGLYLLVNNNNKYIFVFSWPQLFISCGGLLIESNNVSHLQIMCDTCTFNVIFRSIYFVRLNHERWSNSLIWLKLGLYYNFRSQSKKIIYKIQIYLQLQIKFQSLICDYIVDVCQLNLHRFFLLIDHTVV